MYTQKINLLKYRQPPRPVSSTEELEFSPWNKFTRLCSSFIYQFSDTQSAFPRFFLPPSPILPSPLHSPPSSSLRNTHSGGKPAPWLLRSALGHQSLGGVKERGLGREKFGWDVVSRKAGADSQGEPGAWMAWQNCPRGEQGVFVCHHSTIHWVWGPLTPCRRCELGGGTSLQQRAFPGEGGSPEPPGLNLWKNSGLVCSQERIGWHTYRNTLLFSFQKPHFPYLYERVRHTHVLA